MNASAHEALADGEPPPFSLRPGLIVEIIRLYDDLRRLRRTVDDFERLLIGDLEGDAEHDRGAERLLRQTRFLVNAFRRYEAKLSGLQRCDEHGLRAWLLDHPLSEPYIARGPGRRRSRFGTGRPCGRRTSTCSHACRCWRGSTSSRPRSCCEPAFTSACTKSCPASRKSRGPATRTCCRRRRLQCRHLWRPLPTQRRFISKVATVRTSSQTSCGG